MKIEALEEQLLITNSPSFRRMSGKSQVILNDESKNIHVRNRQTHSIEVAVIGKMIATNLLKNKNTPIVDPEVVFNVGLCHDLGHAPIGHVGQKILNEIFSDMGVYFDDNANTLNVIEKDLSKISDLTKLSLIKYPTLIKNSNQKGLYEEQFKRYYKRLLKTSEEQNINKKIKRIRTYESEIMEFADDIAYLTSDIEDSICYYKMKITKTYLEKLRFSLNYYDEEFFELLINLNKDNVFDFMNEIKNNFINNIYYCKKTNKFKEKTSDKMKKRVLRKICKDLYIDKHSILIEDPLMDKYRNYIHFLINNVENEEVMKEHMISRTYLKKILSSYDKKKKLKFLLLSIAELTDQWILNKLSNY